MRRRALLAVAAVALAVGPAALAPSNAEARRVAQRDWSTEIVATLEGGFRMGNPAAAVKLVEFVSLTCPHCRHFAEQNAPELVRDHVRSGRVSFEIRPYPLDPLAALAAQLNRCAAPARAFALNDALLSSQETWVQSLRGLSREQVAALEALPESELAVRLAAITGMNAIAERHGISAAQARACLLDRRGTERIGQIKAAAEALGITGTPSFLVNGVVARDVHDWSQLAPLLGR
jgi:protein-disulfide isomerase